jgi:hypothetical protein
MTDKEQLDRFGEAVEKKKEEAKEKSELPQGVTAGGSPVAGEGEQSAKVDAAHEQDDRDVRAKNSGHKQVTADKWNQ